MDGSDASRASDNDQFEGQGACAEQWLEGLVIPRNERPLDALWVKPFDAAIILMTPQVDNDDCNKRMSDKEMEQCGEDKRSIATVYGK